MGYDIPADHHSSAPARKDEPLVLNESVFLGMNSIEELEQISKDAAAGIALDGGGWVEWDAPLTSVEVLERLPLEPGDVVEVVLLDGTQCEADVALAFVWFQNGDRSIARYRLAKPRGKACPDEIAAKKRPYEIMQEMADTFKARNAVYGDNYLMVGKIMEVMFPNGVELSTTDDFNRWHLYELMIVKLSRFAISGLRHVDSIHDAAVYAAMVQSLIHEDSANLGGKQDV